MSRFACCLALLFLVLLAGCGKPAPDAAAPRDVAAPPPATAEGDFFLVLEVENHTAIVPPMVVEDEAAAGGGKCVRVPLGVGKPPKVQGSVSLHVDVPAAGKAYVWLRAWWNGECSNSVVVKIPGQPPQEIGQDATYNTWHWVKVKGPAIPVKAGAQTIVVDQREDGVGLDQLLLTTDDQYVPMGIEEQ